MAVISRGKHIAVIALGITQEEYRAMVYREVARRMRQRRIEQEQTYQLMAEARQRAIEEDYRAKMKEVQE